jgi:hypothetical protein
LTAKSLFPILWLLAAKEELGVAMTGLSRETRLQIMLDDQELAAIDDWRFKHRMPSRAAAIRDLLQLGLKAKSDGAADPARRSNDFGVLARNSNSGSDR